MNAWKILLAVCVAGVLPMVAMAQQPAEIAKVTEGAVGALARIEFKIENELVGSQRQIGQAVCIDAAQGIFITRDIPATFLPEEMKEFKLATANSGEDKFDAEFLGLEPVRNIAFLKAKGGKWTALKFEDKANVQIGQTVMSVGLLGPGAGNVLYTGLAHVGAKLRLPQDLVYVTGGDLTNASSPVFTTDGKVIGLVGGEIPMEFRMAAGGQWADVLLVGVQRMRFFIPADDFASLLKEVPSKDKPFRLPWLGVVNFEAVSKETEDLWKLNTPAVLLGRIVENSPAAKAGLQQGDAIVGLNGQPLEKMPTAGLVVAQFDRQLARMKSGQEISLTYVRKGEKKDVKVTLEPMPQRAFEAQKFVNKNLGFALRDLVPGDRYSRPQPLKEDGVVVIGVAPNSPAATGSLKPEDIITRINDKQVKKVADLKTMMEDLEKNAKKAPITFMVIRGDQTVPVVVTPVQQP